MLKTITLFLSMLPLIAGAEIPAIFNPIVIEAPVKILDRGRVADLTEAFEKSHAEKKPLLIYIGAHDCYDCKKYTNFISQHEQQFQQIFEPLIIADIRTELTWIPLVFKIHGQRYSFDEFKQQVGDKNKFLTYPYFWLLDAENQQQVRQLPIGTFSIKEVSRHAELLSVTP